MEFIIVLVILAIVAIFVTQPLRRRERPVSEHSNGAKPAARRDDAVTELASLEAAREAKYREIRDAELDHRTGKLSDADHEEVDRSLRAEAVEILYALDEARSKASEN